MESKIHPVLGISPRILVVDNDTRTCESLNELLSYWGYDVVLAEGEGEALIEDAKNKARQHRCQAAIVDMRLIDDFDIEDKSGLDLVAKLAPTHSFVMSGHGDDQTASESLEERGAVGFIGKQWSPEILKQKLERVIHSVCASKKSLTIEPHQVVEEVTQILFQDIKQEYHDQFCDILARLFPTALRLRIEKLGKENDFSDFTTAPRPTSVILKVYERVDEDELQPVVVKFARAEKIEKEVSAYKKYIWRRLVGLYNANMENSVILWDIGGAIYSYFGNLNVTPFYQYARIETLENISNCLRNFFSSTWSRHYQNAKEQSNVSLFETYYEVWGDKWYKRAIQFKDFEPAQYMGQEFSKKVRTPQPVNWLIQNITENKKHDTSRTEKTYFAVTHGDLHGDNLLIDDSHNAWVIDFERCGEGHVLQDFVELESDIINRIHVEKKNADLFFPLCIELISPREIRALPIDHFIGAEPEIRKSLDIISVIRALAHENINHLDVREYLLGLLFNSIFRATITPEKPLAEHQQRALMLASMICHRLDHWDQPWPPKEWREIYKEGES